ncbi:hypothetical protein ACFLSP_02275 [Bacteroidota bacterium]
MKKTVLLLIFILSFFNTTYAQWYERSCGVTDINTCSLEEFECLWNKSTNKLVIGAATSVIGTSIIVGTVIWISNFDTGPESEFVTVGLIIGSLGLGIGLVLNGVGIPIMITGAIRRSNLRKSVHFDTYKIGYLKVSPSLGLNQFNNTYNYGVSLSLTF